MPAQRSRDPRARERAGVSRGRDPLADGERGLVVALPVLAVQEVHDLALGGALVAVALVPSVLTAPLVGVWLDRTAHPRRLVLIGGVVTAVTFAIAAMLGTIPTPVVVGALIISGCATQLFMGGLSSFVAGEVAPDQRAYAVDALAYNVTSVVGPTVVAITFVRQLRAGGGVDPCLLRAAGVDPVRRSTDAPTRGTANLDRRDDGRRHPPVGPPSSPGRRHGVRNAHPVGGRGAPDRGSAAGDRSRGRCGQRRGADDRVRRRRGGRCSHRDRLAGEDPPAGVGDDVRIRGDRGQHLRRDPGLGHRLDSRHLRTSPEFSPGPVRQRCYCSVRSRVPRRFDPRFSP